MPQERKAWSRIYDMETSEGLFLLAVLVLDVSIPEQLSEVLGQAIGQIKGAENEAMEKTDGRVMHSILCFGAEEHRKEEIHAAYDAMWQEHGDLLKVIHGRQLPMALWMIDDEGRPFYVTVQPTKDGSISLGHKDMREEEFLKAFKSAGGWWEMVPLPISSGILNEAKTHVLANRPRPGGINIHNITLLQPEEVIDARISGGPTVLGEFTLAVEGRLHALYEPNPQTPSRGLLVAIGPAQRSQFWLIGENLGESEEFAVQQACSTVDVPKVVEGPVVFAILFSGPESDSAPVELIMPPSLVEIIQQGGPTEVGALVGAYWERS